MAFPEGRVGRRHDLKCWWSTNAYVPATAAPRRERHHPASAVDPHPNGELAMRPPHQRRAGRRLVRPKPLEQRLWVALDHDGLPVRLRKEPLLDGMIEERRQGIEVARDVQN